MTMANTNEEVQETNVPKSRVKTVILYCTGSG